MHIDIYAYIIYMGNIICSPSTCFPKNDIESIPKGVALRLRRICDSDEKPERLRTDYQNYLISRNCKPGKVITSQVK